jgi:hypothetical protein
MDSLELLLRQQRLLARSAQLRERLARDAQAMRAPLSLADRTWALAQWLRRNPAWPLGAAGLLLALRPRRALSWATRLWWTWQALRRLRHWLDARTA